MRVRLALATGQALGPVQGERVMSAYTKVSHNRQEGKDQPGQCRSNRTSAEDLDSARVLPAAITKAASQQTYYTIRFLVDRDRVDNAYRAYAYFRWVDDWLDESALTQIERIAFVERQRALVDVCYHGEPPHDLTTEEWMLVDLLRSDNEPNTGLQLYVRNMMALMAFDAHRRGRLITQAELDDYTRYLAVGVTEALHYFIGHNDPSPHTDGRYLAVTGAHITHMLRDTCEDTAAGYFNISREFLESQHLDPFNVGSTAYRAWVKSRVQCARACFESGRAYLAQVANHRCRLAGYAYMARFQGVLDAIEREDYWLRSDYEDCKRLSTVLRMLWPVRSPSV
jgi:hypothetical protein